MKFEIKAKLIWCLILHGFEFGARNLQCEFYTGNLLSKDTFLWILFKKLYFQEFFCMDFSQEIVKEIFICPIFFPRDSFVWILFKKSLSKTFLCEEIFCPGNLSPWFCPINPYSKYFLSGFYPWNILPRDSSVCIFSKNLLFRKSLSRFFLRNLFAKEASVWILPMKSFTQGSFVWILFKTCFKTCFVRKIFCPRKL